jgi:hypothetical protein
LIFPLGNTAGGTDALINTVYDALEETGEHNTAFGYEVLKDNTDGSYNTGIGSSALLQNTDGHNNTGVGFEALWNNDYGDGNTALGSQALRESVVGQDNTAVGRRAMYNNIIAVGQNTAVGSRALQTAAGWANTAIGAGALGFGDPDFLSGDQVEGNTAIGNNALAYLHNGEGNIVIGANAGSDLGDGDHNILIGYGSPSGEGFGPPESNTMRLGQAAPNPVPPFPVPYISRAFVAGVVGVTTDINDAVAVYIDSDGQLGTISSSARYKQDIHDLGAVSDKVLALRPVSFRYVEPFADGNKPVQYGLIAEEVAEVMPELVVFDQQGKPETVKYHLLSTLLLKELQKQAATNALQQVELLSLQQQQVNEVTRLQAELDLLKAQTGMLLKLVPGADEARIVVGNAQP